MGNIGRTARFGFFETTRMGYVTGPGAADQLVQIMARTFHCQFGSVRIGGKGEASPKGALDYALRTGEYGRVGREKLEELERRKRGPWPMVSAAPRGAATPSSTLSAMRKAGPSSCS